MPEASSVEKRENVPTRSTGVSYTAVLLLLPLYASYAWHAARRCVFDYYCCIGRVNVEMLSWFDLLLLCTSHTHIHRDYWHKGESLEHGCRCIAAAVLLYTDFCGCEAERLLSQKQTRKHRSS